MLPQVVLQPLHLFADYLLSLYRARQVACFLYSYARIISSIAHVVSLFCPAVFLRPTNYKKAAVPLPVLDNSATIRGRAQEPGRLSTA